MKPKSDRSLNAPLSGTTAGVPQTDGECVRALALAVQVTDEENGRIGPYKLLQRIGEGGFGIVWMAEQEIPMRRRVAVKVIKSGMDTREVIARFETERQALAMMDHPNIARVFDAGETTTGRPYFVMELVRGIPITKYCDENSLSTEARLRLFAAVCNGVQHAHQKGVIHRDLKPSNILVTLHDGVPFPKIIDFGIAKATEARLTDKTLFTQFHAFLGTPAYTSPEQMEMSGLDVDTRSDIYSLGVLLYELLAGGPPFDPETLIKSGLDAMRRTIRDVNPPRPSQRVRTLPGELRTTIAQQRGTDGTKLLGRLRGDLDGIVMHCLEKDRTRRYETANDLAADVRRHLSNEPVIARPASAAYRCSKFVRRNRLAFAAGIAVVLSLVAGLVLASVSLQREQAARIREAALRKEADLNATHANAAAAKSVEVARFMNEMLSGAGPSVAMGRDPSLLREIADSTARRLETELQSQPEVAADLRDTLGGIYLALGETTSAEKILRPAVEVHRALIGNDSAETANSLHLLCLALRTRNPPEAEAIGQEALALRKKIFGETHPLYADTLYELAQVPTPSRTTAEMRAMLEQVLAIRLRAFGEEHPAVAQAIAGLGSVAQQDLDHKEGARLQEQALAMRRRLFGNEHPEVAQSLAALGDCYAPELDRRQDAVAAYREAFTLRRKLLGDQHPKVAIPFLGMSGQLSPQTASPEQIAVVRDFVATQRQILPRDSVRLAPLLLALAPLEPATATGSNSNEALVREARALLETSRMHGERFDPEIINAMMIFGWSKVVGNVPQEGLAMAEETVKLAQATFGAEAPGTMIPIHTLAWTDLSLGRQADAIPQFEKAVRLFRSRYGNNHPVMLLNEAALAECYRAVGRNEDARELLVSALAAYRENPLQPDRDAYRAFITAELGITFVRENRHAEAEPLLREALLDYDRPGIRPLGRRLRPPQRVLSALGVALAGQGKFTEAEPLVLQAFEELRASEPRLAGDRASIVREAFEAVIAVYTTWGRADKIAEWKARLREHD
jgi:serine/threonine protein kinase/tetratricopeptide (TPR) repeat protein